LWLRNTSAAVTGIRGTAINRVVTTPQYLIFIVMAKMKVSGYIVLKKKEVLLAQPFRPEIRAEKF